MFIFAFFIVTVVIQYIINKILKISIDNSLGYTYSKRDTFIMIGFLVLSIILQKIMPTGKTYWIGCGIYSTILIVTLSILGAIKRVIVLKQREEIQSVFEVLEPVISNDAKVKNKDTQEFEMKDPNNPPFKLGYEDTKINRITIKINPNNFKESVAVNLCLSLNKYLPNYEWVNEFDFAARECAFVGTPLPPNVAKYKGSWLRPPEFIPIGLSGLGEVSWNLNSIKNEGRSNYIYEDGKISKTVDTPSAPQALCVGSPLGLNTIIPTTTGYKTMKTIEVGDMIFGLDGIPVEVIKVENIITNPKEVYELIFANDFYSIKVISDAIHRFPVITHIRQSINDKSFFKPVQCKDLIKNNSIVEGYNRGFTLISKKKIKPQPVRCITVNSDEHIFLITDNININPNWNGGNKYIGKAIYTYNTGGGKSCYINQEVEVRDETI